MDILVLRRESSLSETRRQKLLKSGAATQLDRIAIELLETERCYVNDLNDIIQVSQIYESGTLKYEQNWAYF